MGKARVSATIVIAITHLFPPFCPTRSQAQYGERHHPSVALPETRKSWIYGTMLLKQDEEIYECVTGASRNPFERQLVSI